MNLHDESPDDGGEAGLPTAGRGSRGIQSVEVGGQLLRALAHAGRPMPLKDLAREAGMPAAKAHPYLVSFGKIGLVEQDAGNGRYGLGPLALQLGLIALQQVDPIRLASAELPALARTVGHTCAIAVWGSQGPTIIRVEQGPGAVHVVMRHGTTVSLRGTASGLLFAAHRPSAEVATLLLRQRDGAMPPNGSEGGSTFQDRLAAIRAAGFSIAADATVPGVTALAVPVFDAQRRLVLALTAIGPSAMLAEEGHAAVVSALGTCADGLSARLGAGPSQGVPVR
jgi:DNA-binding IclR family transcriptional regulator